MEEQGVGGQEVGEEEGEAEEAALPYWMALRMRGEEAVGEEPQQLRHGLEEGGAGHSLGWAGEAVERTCPVGMAGEEGAQRRELWRGEEVAGHLAPGQEEGEEEGLSCGVGVGEGGHLWMEGEEELERKSRKLKLKENKAVIIMIHHSEFTLQP